MYKEDTFIDDIYFDGIRLAKDKKWDQAIEKFKQSINQGNVRAWTDLGEAYQNMNDFTNAEQCYIKSAHDYWNIDAEQKLGEMYYEGKGVECNKVFGAQLLSHAAACGQMDAIYYIFNANDKSMFDQKLVQAIQTHPLITRLIPMHQKAKNGVLMRQGRMMYTQGVMQLRQGEPDYMYIQQLYKKAKQGDEQACMLLVDSYLTGKKVKEPSKDKAIELLMEIKGIAQEEAEKYISEM